MHDSLKNLRSIVNIVPGPGRGLIFGKTKDPPAPWDRGIRQDWKDWKDQQFFEGFYRMNREGIFARTCASLSPLARAGEFSSRPFLGTNTQDVGGQAASGPGHQATRYGSKN